MGVVKCVPTATLFLALYDIKSERNESFSFLCFLWRGVESEHVMEILQKLSNVSTV